MAHNENFDEANEGAPAADIPNLKNKEKERKKAGVAWTSGAKPGGALTGATGGTVARSAASVIGVSGEAAAVGAGAGAGGMFGLSTTMLAAGAGALVLSGAAAAYMMFGRGGTEGMTGGGEGNLGALASSLKVRGGGSGDRTGYVASKGEISFDPVAAAAKIEAAPEQDASQGETAAVKEDTSEPLPDWRQAGLAHNLTGSKLSSSFGNEFGSKNIFGGNGAAPKLNNAIGKVNIAGGQGGKLSAMRNPKPGRLTQGVKGAHSRAKNAFGQLKVAKGLSMAGANATVSEGARSTAGAAFDGQMGAGNVEGAAPGTGVPDMTTGPNPTDPGAPDVTAPDVEPPHNPVTDPNITAGLAAIGALAQQAGQMKKQGMLLLLIGLAMMTTMFLMPIGLILVGMGLAMIQMSGSMKNMADSMSQATAARTGNINQNAINQYCINKAYTDGSSTNNCNPPDSITQGSKFDAATNPQVEQHREMVRVDGAVEDANGSPIAP